MVTMVLLNQHSHIRFQKLRSFLLLRRTAFFPQPSMQPQLSSGVQRSSGFNGFFFFCHIGLNFLAFLIVRFP
jgi:hypothetical protein